MDVLQVKVWKWKCESEKVKVWKWKCESESVKVWKWKCESVKVKVWKWKCESESVKVKVWKWKCESESVKVWKCESESLKVKVKSESVLGPRLACSSRWKFTLACVRILNRGICTLSRCPQIFHYQLFINTLRCFDSKFCLGEFCRGKGKA